MPAGSVILLGGTELTLRIADALRDVDVALAAIVHVGERVAISYRPGGMVNSRHADVPGWCAAHGVPAVAHVGGTSLAETLTDRHADLLLAAGWYHMVPRAVRERFPRGAVGFHGSLLPRLRGGAPIAWAILEGHDETGMSLFTLAEGVDTGELWGQRTIPIGPRTDAAELVAAGADAAVELAREVVPGILDGSAAARPQTGAPSIGLQRGPEDGAIDWTRPTIEIDRLVRAVTRPYPGAFTALDGRRFRVWRGRPWDGPRVLGAPGQLFRLGPDEPLAVVTGDGGLVIEAAEYDDGSDALAELRRASQRRLDSAAPSA
jgi:methionyl-tRNA formyltransferase